MLSRWRGAGVLACGFWQRPAAIFSLRGPIGGQNKVSSLLAFTPLDCLATSRFSRFHHYRRVVPFPILQRLPRFIKKTCIEDFSGCGGVGLDAGIEDSPIGQLRGLE